MSNFNYNEFAMEDAWVAYLNDFMEALDVPVLRGSDVNEYPAKCVVVTCPETVEPPELFGTATNATTVDVSVVTAASETRDSHIALVADVMDRVFDDGLVTGLNAKATALVCQRVERQARRTRFDDTRMYRITTQRVQILCSMDG